MNLIHLNKLVLNNASLNALGSFEGKAGGVKVEWKDIVLEGTDILSVSEAKANSISSLIVSGYAAIENYQIPYIRSNKGLLRLETGVNLLEVKDENIVVGKYVNNAGVPTDSLPNCYFQRFVGVKPSTTYTLSASETLNYANFMEYDSSGVFIKRTLYGSSTAPAGTTVSHTMGDTTAFVIIGSNVNSTKYPSITKADVKGIKWMFNEGSSARKYEAYSGKIVVDGNDTISVYGKNLSVGELISKGYASTGAVSTSTTFCGNLHKFPVSEGQTYTVSWGNVPNGVSGVFINTWKKDGSWNARQAISATDHLTYTIPSGVGEVNFTLYKTGGITIGEDTWLQVEYGDTATEYVPAVTPKSASAELLLALPSVHDYDQQDVISGDVTRVTGLKSFDGSEDFVYESNGWQVAVDASDNINHNTTTVCSHFVSSSAPSRNTVILRKVGDIIYIRFCVDQSLEDFRKFLQMEYAKGSPVILVYGLKNPTTKNVAPQPLANPEGDVIINRNYATKSVPMVATLKVKMEEAGAPIVFYIEDQEFSAKGRMTWAEWCDDPELNPDGYYINDDGWVELYVSTGWLGEYFSVNFESKSVLGADAIKPNASYYRSSAGIG